MSLAFDKDGQPFTFLPKTVALLVRRFRNPGGRGTCEQVFDDDGDALILDASATVAELRAAVGHVAGLYRLDQCDEEGEIIAGAPAAYIAIDPPRNGSPGSSTDPLMIVRDLAQMHAEVSKTLADRSAGMMQAATENMRVATGGGLGNRRLLGALANAASVVDAQAGEDDDDDDDDRNEEEAATPQEPQPDPWAMVRPFTPMLTAMAPKIGEAIAAKLIDLMNQFMKAGPAAAPGATTTTASATAAAPSQSGVTADGAAAGQGPTGAANGAPTGSSSSASPAETPVASPAMAEPSAEAVSVASGEASTASATTAMGSVMEVRNATPTGGQIAHLLAIRAQLAPREVAIVDRAIAGMDEPTRAWWLGKLSALTVDQGAVHVRSLIPTTGTRGDEGEE